MGELTQVRQLNYFSIFFRDPDMVADWFWDHYGGYGFEVATNISQTRCSEDLPPCLTFVWR